MENKKVMIEVENFGNIEVELFEDIAPITVKNFCNLVENNFYNKLTFHRVVKGFMIQGGCPKGNGTGGSTNQIKGEFSSNGIKNDLKHNRGIISMARSSMPNSASSQFFIMHHDSPYLDGQYASFGRVVSGMEVVDKIADSRVGGSDKPLEKIVFSIRFI